MYLPKGLVKSFLLGVALAVTLSFLVVPSASALVFIEGGTAPDNAIYRNGGQYGFVAVETNDPDNPSGIYVWPFIKQGNPGITTDFGSFWVSATETLSYKMPDGTTGTLSVNAVGDYWFPDHPIFLSDLSKIGYTENYYVYAVYGDSRFWYWHGVYQEGAKYIVGDSTSFTPVDGVGVLDIRSCQYAVVEWTYMVYPVSCVEQGYVYRVWGSFEFYSDGSTLFVRSSPDESWSTDGVDVHSLDGVDFYRIKKPYNYVSCCQPSPYSMVSVVFTDTTSVTAVYSELSSVYRYTSDDLPSIMQSLTNYTDNYFLPYLIYRYPYGSYQPSYVVSTATISYYGSFADYQSVSDSDGSVPTSDPLPDIWSPFASALTSLLNAVGDFISVVLEFFRYLLGFFSDFFASLKSLMSSFNSAFASIPSPFDLPVKLGVYGILAVAGIRAGMWLIAIVRGVSD